MTAEIITRIEDLKPRLSRMAEQFSFSCNVGAADLYQSMVVTLLERQAADPTFAEQSDSYILDAGRKYVCQPALRKTQVENKYTVGEPEPAQGFEGESFFDSLIGDEPNPEDAYINLETALAVAQVLRDNLSGREREVISLVVKGVPTNKIADKFGVTPAAVSIYKRRVIGKLQAAVL